MALAGKIAYNIFASSASKILSTILALVAIGFLTRYLGQEGFGNYATVLAFLSLFTALADLGLYHIATREISRPQADAEKILGNVFAIRLIASFSIFILSPFIVFLLDYPPEVKRGIIIIAAAFLFSSSYQVLNGIFQKNLAMDKVSLAEFSGKIIQTAAIIFAVKYELGFDWIMSSLFLFMFFTFLVVFFLSRRYVKLRLRFDFSYWKKFLLESYPMGIAAIVTFIYFKADTLLLSFIQDSTAVGIYNLAYKILENITFFPAMVAGLVLPIFSYTIFEDRQKFRLTADKTFKFFVVLIVPLISGTMFFAGDIISLIGGNAFPESTPVLKILIFALAMIFFGHFFNSILIAGNLQKKMMRILVLAAILNFTLNLFFIPKFSYLAAAFISLATEMFVVGATAYLVAKNLLYTPSLPKWGNLILSGLMMIFIFTLTQRLPFFLSAIFGVIAYFYFLWTLKVIKTQEIISLFSRKGIQNYEEIS